MQGEPGPPADGHTAAKHLSSEGQANFEGLSDQTVGAGAHITDFLHEFS